MIGKIDEYGKIGWVTAVVVGFWLAWPIGLAMLAFLAGSGRLREMRSGAPGTWFNLGTNDNRWNAGWKSGWGRPQAKNSGNKAFDEYRDETLRRLEDEEREFQAFLDRLRKARDKSEFDQFMNERRSRSTPVQDVTDVA